MYGLWVKTPVTAEEARSSAHEFNMAGFHGCVGSSDATHVTWEKCYAKLKNQHTSFKSSLTTRAFNLTVNHRRRILASTLGVPGSWNDKTLVRFDHFLCAIRDGRTLEDAHFELLEKREDGEVVAVRYRGVWIMVDNGYLHWPVTVPPLTTPVNALHTFLAPLPRREDKPHHAHAQKETYSELRWSKWLESMRKDVECTFGIMKGR